MRISDQFTKNFDDKHIVSAGFEYSHDKVITANGVKLINKAVYIQDQFNITDQLKLTPEYVMTKIPGSVTILLPA